ncbi:MAG: VTT domain-containing protein [Planctomycetes bacterium]|nr:VTT domain-containing protein [Planctomycetota bacterium]
MRPLVRMTLVAAGAVVVPVLPLLVLGLSFESELEAWLRREVSPLGRCAMLVALLAGDIVLPVPSSAVSTYGGGILGTGLATLASWLGMTLGAVAGFALARLFGERIAVRLAGREDLERMAALSRRYGPAALAITRALPILAEACVLLMGATRLSWRRFLPPVLVCNLIISFVYAAFGEFFRNRNALPAAVVLSGTVPLIVALVARSRLRRPHTDPFANRV